MSAIRFERVSMRFPGTSRLVVNDCSFEVATGQLVVILGPSGCGKTTLLKLVNRLYEATAGKIYLHGSDIRQLGVTALRRQIGYVIQQSGLFPHMTVAENIAVVPRLLGWQKEKIQARVDELLGLIQLPPQEYCRRYPAQLSGGQQQRVGLARGLAGNPEVLLMDEPFGAIDAITRADLQDEILRLQRQLQKTILFVSHDVEEALRLADRLLILERGQVVQYDTPFNILTRPADAFVHDLVGAGDAVRQLSLLRVETAMRAIPPTNNHDPVAPGQSLTIDCQDNLRNALSLLLSSGVPELTVVHEGVAIGVITLEQIRKAARVRARV